MPRKKKSEENENTNSIMSPLHRLRKTKYKFVPKNRSQQKFLESIEENNIVFNIGSAGTGKSFAAVAYAIEAFSEKKNKYKKLIFVRPAIEACGEKIGSLPGLLEEKMAPYMQPIYDILFEYGISRNDIGKLLDDDIFEVCPLGFMRGRAQPLSEIVYTPCGEKKMGDLKVGDLVLGSDGKSKQIKQVHEQGIKKIYRVYFSDGTSTRCTSDHLWATKTLYEKKHKKPFSVKETSEIMNSLRIKSNQKNHEIPVLSNSLEFKKREVDIDPYLLGLLLGDGHLGKKASVSFSTDDEELVKYVKDSVPKEIIVKRSSSNKYNYILSIKKEGSKRNPLRTYLSNLNLIGKNGAEKFVPKIYLFNDSSIRLEILRGLMDSDGTIFKHKSGSCRVQFSSISEQLSKDVAFLVRSLGGICHITEREHKESDRRIKHRYNSFVVDIVLPKDVNPFRLERKRDKFIKPCRVKKLISNIVECGEEECRCITIDSKDNLYVTNDFILTHNSLNNVILIAEEAQNMNSPQMEMLLTRIGKNSKFIVTGDVSQRDSSRALGVEEAHHLFKDTKGIDFIYFSSSETLRDSLVESVVNKYADFRENNKGNISPSSLVDFKNNLNGNENKKDFNCREIMGIEEDKN